ncbi:MAG: hypothetical protein IJ713_04220 [Oscillibacter sp.]|nr:hypothetical protein [Oscillibacter sp.]
MYAKVPRKPAKCLACKKERDGSQYCGHHFLRKHFSGKYGKTEWICYQYLRKGRSSCPSQKIQETVLIEKTKEVLGTDTLSRALLEEKLVCITIPEHNHMIFDLKDGRSIDVFWKHTSRSKSWTPEMRQMARERALKQRGKEEK